MPVAKKSQVLTADGKLVDDDGKATGVVVSVAGANVDQYEVDKYGLDVEDGAPPAPAAGISLGADKAAADKAASNKAAADAKTTT